MITTEVFEPDEINDKKQIFYRDNDDITIRVSTFDRNGSLLTDELTEFNSNKQILTTVVYNNEYLTVLSYREYYYDKNGNEIGFGDYKRKNEVLEKVCSVQNITLIENEKYQVNWYDGNDKFIFSELFIKDEECGMIQDDFLYDENGDILDRSNIKLETYHIY